MYWALELAETYAGYLWERFTIIANEDIGLADANVIILTEALRNQFELVRKKRARAGASSWPTPFYHYAGRAKRGSRTRSWR